MTGKKLRHLVPPKVLTELESSGVPWEIEQRKRHFFLRVNGRVVGLLPRGGITECASRNQLSLRAHVRRALEALR